MERPRSKTLLYLAPGSRVDILSAPETCVRRLRPFARRAASTLRPPFVAMRARYPIFLFRLIFDGCHVIFMICFSFQMKFQVLYQKAVLDFKWPAEQKNARALRPCRRPSC